MRLYRDAEVGDYLKAGPRYTQWTADDVIKYHRAVATYINTLIGSGFRNSKLSESEPSQGMLAEQPSLRDDCCRPTFLLISAVKTGTPQSWLRSYRFDESR